MPFEKKDHSTVFSEGLAPSSLASHTLHVFSVKFFSSSEKWRFAFISKAAGYSPCDKRESNRYGLENSPLCWKNGVLALEESLDTISDSRVTRARLGLPFVEESSDCCSVSTEPGEMAVVCPLFFLQLAVLGGNFLHHSSTFACSRIMFFYRRLLLWVWRSLLY